MEIMAFDLDELKEIMEEEKITDLIKADNGAHLTLSYFGGIKILINKTGDCVFHQRYDGKIKESEIQFDDEDPYFEDGADVYFINEFLRNNFGIKNPRSQKIPV